MEIKPRNNVTPIGAGFKTFKEAVEYQMAQTNIFKHFLTHKYGIELLPHRDNEPPVHVFNNIVPIDSHEASLIRLADRLSMVQDGLDKLSNQLRKERIKNGELIMKLSTIQKSIDNFSEDLMISSEGNHYDDIA